MKNDTSNKLIEELNQKVIDTRNEIEQLTKEIEISRLEKAKELPSYLGVDNMIEALQVLKNANVLNNLSTIKTYHNSGKYVSRQGKKIPDRIRVLVKAEVEKGNLTGTEIAKKLHISLPSVQNIKKELGMIRAYSSSN